MITDICLVTLSLFINVEYVKSIPVLSPRPTARPASSPIITNSHIDSYFHETIYSLTTVTETEPDSSLLSHVYDGNKIADLCPFKIQTDTEESINLHEGVKASTDIVMGLLGITSFINPASAILNGMILAGRAFFDLLIPADNDPIEQVYENMAKMFDQLWQCTELYVENSLDLALTALYEHNQESISNLIYSLQEKLALLAEKGSDIERYQSFDNLAIHTAILNMIDEFPYYEFSTLTPKECRGLIPLTINAMNMKIIAYNIYYLLAMTVDGTIYESPWDLPKSQSFRNENAKLIKLYSQCAHHAYFDILTESESLSITQIQNEIDILFNSDSFCAWIEHTYSLSYREENGNKQYSYDFGTTLDDFEYERFEFCDHTMFTNDIMTAFNEVYGNNPYFTDNIFAVNVLFGGNSDIDLKFINDINLGKHVRDQYFCPNDQPAVTCSAYSKTLITNGAETYRYYFGYSRDRTYLRTTLCVNCNGEYTNEETISCPSGTKRSGGRYLIQYEGHYSEPSIVGIQFLCTNVYDETDETYETIHVLGDNIGDFEWSPWFLCPKGLSGFDISFGGIAYYCSVTDYLKNVECSNFFCSGDCYRKFLWQSNDVSVTFTCN